jgi:HAD superfamily hydrolase (TIGR01484 family)
MTRIEENMIKLLAFDLDGTLTQHKTPLTEDYRELLVSLSKKYRLLIVGAGRCKRIRNQIGELPIDIIGNYGMEYCKYDSESGKDIMLRSEVLPTQKEDLLIRAQRLREKFGFFEYYGEPLEFHSSGCVTIPLLGTAAVLEDKLRFDPTREKRRKIYKDVVEAFPEYKVFIGGSSSFDMAPKPFDKLYALGGYLSEHGISEDECVFFGDDYGEGGNDESILHSGIKFIKIDSYLLTGRILEDFLNNEAI